MKQGRASSSGPGERKMTPSGGAINPGYASQLGNKVGTVRSIEPMSGGRGFTSPSPKAVTVHRRGSQRRS